MTDPTPAWQTAVRAIGTATDVAIDALRAAFPVGSRWLLETVTVEILGPHLTRPGYVWVRMAQHEFWSRTTWAGCLRPVPPPPATETTP